jgi:hypothetical protein
MATTEREQLNRAMFVWEHDRKAAEQRVQREVEEAKKAKIATRPESSEGTGASEDNAPQQK